MNDVTNEVLQYLESLDLSEAGHKNREETALRLSSLPQLHLPEDADENEMRRFFSPKVLSTRTLLCFEVNVDLTDDWGIFGYELGFIFITGLSDGFSQANTPNEIAWMDGLLPSWVPRFPLPILQHFDFFPRDMFSYALITERRDPKMFRLLCQVVRELLNQPALPSPAPEDA